MAEEKSNKPVKKKKTFTKAPDLSEIDDMASTCGLSKNTLKKRALVEEMFGQFLKFFEFTKNLDKLC